MKWLTKIAIWTALLTGAVLWMIQLVFERSRATNTRL
jgi:hypothetical protein